MIESKRGNLVVRIRQAEGTSEAEDDEKQGRLDGEKDRWKEE